MNNTKEWESKWDEIVEELLDWNEGTIYKQYDNEETALVLKEDTLEYLKKLKALIKNHPQ